MLATGKEHSGLLKTDCEPLYNIKLNSQCQCMCIDEWQSLCVLLVKVVIGQSWKHISGEFCQ